MTEWKTEKAKLDIAPYIAELFPSRALSLSNDHVKEEYRTARLKCCLVRTVVQKASAQG